MSALDRYVIRHIFGLTAIVALALVTIYTLVVFVTDVSDTGRGSYGVLQAFEYSLLMVPSSLYILMPIVALLGTLLGVGLLARNSELTAMRAAGTSIARLGAATLLAGAALGALGFALGDWLGPAGESAANALRDRARGDSGMDRSLWLRDAGTILRIRRLVAENYARDVTLYRMTGEGRLAEVADAGEARYLDGHWQLGDVHGSRIDGGRVSTTSGDTIQLDGGITPNVLRLFILEADSLSVPGLYRLVHYMDANRLDATRYRIWLWRKLVEPLTVMAMMLFAVPFVIGTLRDTGAGQRLLAGVLIGIVFYVVNKVSVSLGDLYQWPAALAAGLPTAALAMIAVLRLRRAG